jgi:hypothetical protein
VVVCGTGEVVVGTVEAVRTGTITVVVVVVVISTISVIV